MLGHILVQSEHFDNFVRFFQPIQPQLQYFASPYQVVNTVEQNHKPGNIIVIVGGSSIFRGTGQNTSQLWTNRLRENLGDKFEVFNVSIDQQTMEGFGSVIFRILKDRYPSTLYVGLSSTEHVGPMDGIPIYRYFFWDAYYSGMLQLDEDDSRVARELRQSELKNTDGRSLHVASWLESIVRFRSIFNEISYRAFFPMFVANTGADWFLPRDTYKDIDVDWSKIQAQVRGDVQHHQLICGRFGDLAKLSMPPLPGHGIAPIHQDLLNGLDKAFSTRLRPSIVAVLTLPNPEYLRDLNPETLSLLKAHYEKGLAIHRELGYRTLLVGDDFLPDDYVDQGHFTASGGRKLADLIAPDVRKAAQELGFFQP